MQEANRSVFLSVYCLLGVFVGGGLDWLYQHEVQSLVWYVLIGSFGFFYAMSFDQKNSGRLLVSSGICSLLFAFPILFYPFDIHFSDFKNHMGLYGALPLYLFILNCFHSAIHTENTIAIHYRVLFAATWNTLPLLLAAIIILAASYSMISLTCRIFNFIDFPVLQDLFFGNRQVFYIVNIVLFFAGIGIARQSIRFIYRMRMVLLNTMQYLYPLLAIVTISFFIMYLAKNEFNQPYFIYRNDCLIALAVVGIVFFNAIYQDGMTRIVPDRSVGLLLRLYRLVLFCLALIGVFNNLRNESHTLNGVLFLVLIPCYGALYAVSVYLDKKSEQKCITRGNILFAGLFVAIMLIINNPFYPLGDIIIIQNPDTPLASPEEVSLEKM